jgi:hypothetical protein
MSNKQIFWDIFHNCNFILTPNTSLHELLLQVEYFDFDPPYMDYASYQNCVCVLDYHLLQYLHNGIPLKYTEMSLSYAVMCNAIKVLDWWHDAHLKYGIAIKFTPDTCITKFKQAINWVKNNIQYFTRIDNPNPKFALRYST